MLWTDRRLVAGSSIKVIKGSGMLIFALALCATLVAGCGRRSQLDQPGSVTSDAGGVADPAIAAEQAEPAKKPGKTFILDPLI